MNLSALTQAIVRGEVQTVEERLRASPELATARTRSEMWEGLDSVIALLGATPLNEHDAPTDFASVEATIRGIERRSHTAVGLSRMLESYASGNVVDGQGAADGLTAADTTCFHDAARVLSMLDRTTWGSPLRMWLRETLRPAQVIALVERYEVGRNETLPASRNNA